ncbi:hypothetical protein D3C76_163670 [compost metagenome]
MTDDETGRRGIADMTTETYNTIDIEVMKSELSDLRTDVHQIVAKMDIVLQMQVSITQLQERHETHKSAQDRSFTAIKENKAKADKTADELSRVISFVKGGVAIGVVLFAFAQWYTLQQITKIERASEAFIIIDRRLTFIESKLWPDVRPSMKQDNQ